MAQEKIYAGKGKKKGDTWLQITVDPNVINQHIQDFNGKKFVKLNVNIGKPDQYGKDVQVTIDTWQPTTQANPQGAQTDDLPF